MRREGVLVAGSSAQRTPPAQAPPPEHQRPVAPLPWTRRPNHRHPCPLSARRRPMVRSSQRRRISAASFRRSSRASSTPSQYPALNAAQRSQPSFSQSRTCSTNSESVTLRLLVEVPTPSRLRRPPSGPSARTSTFHNDTHPASRRPSARQCERSAPLPPPSQLRPRLGSGASPCRNNPASVLPLLSFFTVYTTLHSVRFVAVHRQAPARCRFLPREETAVKTLHLAGACRCRAMHALARLPRLAMVGFVHATQTRLLEP